MAWASCRGSKLALFCCVGLVLCATTLQSFLSGVQAKEDVKVYGEGAEDIKLNMKAAGSAMGEEDFTAEDEDNATTLREVDALKEKRIDDSLTPDQKEKLSFEEHEYQVEVVRLMDVIINSLYQHKEVFLRELISNAADALEKIRFLSLEKPEELETNKDLSIFVDFSKDDKTITVSDSGVGMTKQDLINNLGTVAKSGTNNFLEAMAQAGDANNLVNLIGQFGVGFYSAYLVADKVVVTSKNNHDDQYIWESSATGHFKVSKDPRGNTLGRGTRITLHLKEDSLKMLNETTLQDLCHKWSQFISFPIKMLKKKSVSKDVDIPEEEREQMKKEQEEERAKSIEERKKEAEEAGEEFKEDPEDSKEIEIPKTKKVQETVIDWEQINVEKAIWMRPPKDVRPEEYPQFFKVSFKEYSDPLSYIHFTAEGEIEFKSILFIPNRAPSDMFANYRGDERTIKLYARRVFVGDKFQEDLIPQYLNFVKGVVDSDDLPLNVSRESLQQSKILNVIQKKLTRKLLDLFKKMAKDSDAANAKYEKDVAEITGDDEEAVKKRKELESERDEADKYKIFMREFGRNLKLGCYDDDSNRSKIGKLLRVHTSVSGDKAISFDTYVSRMPDSQKVIYYAFGESREQLEKLPQMQIMRKKNIEVVYLTETMDEPCVQKLSDFDGKKFESIQKGDLSLELTDEEKTREKKLKKMYDPLLTTMKQVLSTKVMRVTLSRRLVEAPVAVVSSGYGYSAYMEKIMKSQTFADPSQVNMMAGQKTLEVNPDHPLIYDLLQKHKANKDDPKIKEMTNNLFEGAMLASGFDVSSPEKLAALLYRHMSSELGVDLDAEFQPVDVSSIPDDEEGKKDDADDDVALDDDEDELELGGGDEAEKTDEDKKQPDDDEKKDAATTHDEL